MATKFASDLRAHIENWSAGTCPRPLKYANWLDGIHPDYRELARNVKDADEVMLDANVAHLLSSQAFALNLFLPFRKGSKKNLSKCP